MGSEVITSEGFKLYYHKASEKKHPETIVFVHHMWGSHKTTWRHFRLLNELGYDCVTFDLILGNNLKNDSLHPYVKHLPKSIYYIWEKQIDAVLENVSGDKIVFSFSGPSIPAIASILKRQDIKKFICDGGPFHNIYSCTRNFFYKEVGIKPPLINIPVTFIGTIIWSGTDAVKKAHKNLKDWNLEIPILSIRGTKDDIVPIHNIRDLFAKHPKLNLTILELPGGKHMDGLREFPQEYKEALKKFLQS